MAPFLSAALNTTTGEVLGKTANRHTSAEFVEFLGELVAPQPPEIPLHIIADNPSAHKTKAVEDFLSAHPNVQLHYTPTYSSWLNQVEIWFSKIQKRSHRPWHLRLQERSPSQNHALHPPLQ